MDMADIEQDHCTDVTCSAWHPFLLTHRCGPPPSRRPPTPSRPLGRRPSGGEGKTHSTIRKRLRLELLCLDAVDVCMCGHADGPAWTGPLWMPDTKQCERGRTDMTWFCVAGGSWLAFWVLLGWLGLGWWLCIHPFIHPSVSRLRFVGGEDVARADWAGVCHFHRFTSPLLLSLS